MIFSKKTTLRLGILFVTAITFAFIGSSCDGTEDPRFNDNPAPTPEINSFLFTSTVNATHIIGTSSCPQKIAEIKTFCGRSGDSCTADSAVITNPHPGLDASFDNGQQSTSLDNNPQGHKTLKINFNCQVAMTFTNKYKIEFYKDGVKVDEQELTVNMTVK